MGGKLATGQFLVSPGHDPDRSLVVRVRHQHTAELGRTEMLSLYAGDQGDQQLHGKCEVYTLFKSDLSPLI